MKNWYIFIGSDEYYNYGQITQVIDELILVELMSVSGIPKHSRLYHLPCLAHSDDVMFFEHKEQLDEWLKWLETPTNKPKIVNIKDPH